jgi:hypothetical protein
MSPTYLKGERSSDGDLFELVGGRKPENASLATIVLLNSCVLLEYLFNITWILSNFFSRRRILNFVAMQEAEFVLVKEKDSSFKDAVIKLFCLHLFCLDLDAVFVKDNGIATTVFVV